MPAASSSKGFQKELRLRGSRKCSARTSSSATEGRGWGDLSRDGLADMTRLYDRRGKTAKRDAMATITVPYVAPKG